MNKTATPQPSKVLSRRTVFAGAGTAGALAAAASVLPGLEPATVPGTPVADAIKAAGYQETQHVQRYYQTARV